MLCKFINGRTVYKPNTTRNYNKCSEFIQRIAVQNEFYVDNFPPYLDTGFIIVWEVCYDDIILLFHFFTIYKRLS